MANPWVSVSFLAAILAAIFMVSYGAPQRASSETPTFPKIVRPTLSAEETKRLQSRYGQQVLSAIQSFRNTWYTYFLTNKTKFMPTANQAMWFATLTKPPTSSQRSKRSFVLRREYRQLSHYQRSKFHNAIKAMKSSMIDGMSEYDIFVKFHIPSNSPAAHGGAAFLPWHREYLMRFENALQTHDSSVSLPYWDSELDGFLPQPKDSIMWSNSYMGDNSGLVTAGPFANWNVVSECLFLGSKLTRNVGPVSASALIDDSDVTAVHSHSTFQGLASFPFQFEGAHGGPHVYVGGHMGHPVCSPSDPIFWMHHAFIDRLWEDFRQNSQTTDLETEYPTHTASVNIGGTAHNPFSVMEPFGPLVNRDGLSDHYTNNHYQYAPRPVTCTSNSQCGPSLWCHGGRCKSKVKRNGLCNGFPLNSSSPCECGKCVIYGGARRCRASTKWECLFLIAHPDIKHPVDTPLRG